MFLQVSLDLKSNQVSFIAIHLLMVSSLMVIVMWACISINLNCNLTAYKMFWQEAEDSEEIDQVNKLLKREDEMLYCIMYL